MSAAIEKLNQTPVTSAKMMAEEEGVTATATMEGNMDDAVANVELSAEDMNDPDLLAQLRSIGWKETQDTPAVTTTTAGEQQKAQKLSRMKDEANALKMQALAAKKKGDLPTAKTLYKQFKDVSAAIEKL